MATGFEPELNHFENGSAAPRSYAPEATIASRATSRRIRAAFTA